MLKTFSTLNRHLFTTIVLGVIITYTLYSAAYPAFTFPWYINTEEFPYIQEVIRFIELDFRQQFFDIPGTPLMLVGAFFWFLYYHLSVLLGYAEPDLGIRFFSFDHMQQLYMLMRLLSYVSYAASIILTFAIARRLLNTVSGYIAALLLAVSPAYGFTILHLRIEPTSLMFVLFSVWLILRAASSGKYSLYLLSGICSGLAMATRFPSLLAGLSVILAYCILYPKFFQEEKKQRLNTFFFMISLVILNLSGLIVLLKKLNIITRNLATDLLLITAEGNYPNATGKIQNLWLILFTISLVLTIAFALPKTREKLRYLVHSSILTVCFGCFTGFILGVPTLLWSGNYFLASVEMFLVRNQVGQTFIQNFWDMVYLFLFGLPPWNDASIDRLTKSLEIGLLYTPFHVIFFFLGLFIIFYKAKKQFYPLLFGIVVGIVSQYGKLQTVRHLVAWLPYFLLIIAIPLASLYEKLKTVTSSDQRRWNYSFFSLFILVALFVSTYSFQVNSLQVVEKHFQEKLSLLPAMDAWISNNTLVTDKIFYTCCEPVNQEVVLDWMQRNGVSIPKGIRTTKNSIIWFGDKEALIQAGKGFIVISTATYPVQYIDYYKKVSPKRLVNPFEDPHFTLKATIDSEQDEKTTSYQVYAFDMTKK